MKRVLTLSIVAAFILALPMAHSVWGKAHVPTKKVQVCHEGETNTVSKNALGAHLNHGDCQLPACDFNNIFRTGVSCPSADVDPADDKCDLPNPRDEASGTPGCPAGGGVF